MDWQYSSALEARLARLEVESQILSSEITKLTKANLGESALIILRTAEDDLTLVETEEMALGELRRTYVETHPTAGSDDMNNELDRLRMAAFLLETWLAGRPLEYTDYMVTDEVKAVLDIGDAINSGELELVPVAQTVLPGRPLPPPFILTESILAQTERLESAIDAVRQRMRDLMGSN